MILGILQSIKKNYYKLVQVGNVLSNDYIEYESNGDRNKTLSIKEYLYKITPYIKDILNDFKNQIKQMS